MKNVSLLLLLCSFAISTWAQIPFPNQQPQPVTPNLLNQPNSSGSRALNSITVDYPSLETLRNPTEVFYTTWAMNRNYLLNIPPASPGDTSDNFTVRWVSVLFNSIHDTDNDVAYDKSTFTSLRIDSITFTCGHQNISGLNDTLFITIYEAANTANGYTFQSGTGNNENYTPSNTVLYRDTIVFNTSLTTAGNYGTFIVPVGLPNVGVSVPVGSGFIVKLDYAGPEVDVFEILDFNRYPCGTASGAASALIPNSVRWFNLWFNNTQDFRGVDGLILTTQPTGCQNYFFQNIGIGAIVTFDDGAAAACPDAPTGTSGFRPNYNSLACINQSTAYNSQVSFEVPVSYNLPPTVTINNVVIDSIINLPCGITYTLDRVNATYNGGEVGCITFSGTTTSPVGAYRMQVYATVNTNFGSFPGTDLSTIGFEYYLRVIANGATACATVASGTTGLTANCTPTTPPTTTPSASPATICLGSSTTLNANASGGTAPYTYDWSATGGITPASVATPTVSPTATTTYTVTVTATGGATATGSVTVTVNNAPSATITGSTTICSGGNTTLTAPAGLQYAWSTGGTGQSITVTTAGTYSVTTTQNGCTATSSVNITVGNPTATITPNGPTTFCTGGNVVLSAPAGFTYTWSANAANATTQSVTATQSGTYSVTVSAGGSCTATSSVSVTVNPTPSATITPNGPTTFCSGGSVVLSAPAGNTYLWSANAGNATTQTVTATQSGTYSVTVTSNGCTATSSVAVTATNAPSAVITPNGPTTFCTGGNVVLSAPAGLSYQWSANAGNSTNQTVTVSQSGTYSVTTTQGSCTATSSVVVNVVSAPSATITPNGPTTFCAGGNVVLSAPAGYDYEWSANAGNATTRTVTVTQSGTYSVTVSAGASCTATSSATVTVNSLPTVTISASGPTTFCTGGSVTLTASSGTGYLWSNGSTSSSISATQAGTYEVTVTSANGCSNSASQVVNIVSTPSATITPSGSTSICPGSSVTLSAPSGYTYSWSNSANTESITVQLAGTYSVTVSAGASCTATSSVTITALTAPDATVTPAGPVTICAGETVTLSAVGGLLYEWSNGATTQTISPTLAGSYTVTVTNANNCEAVSAPITVTAANPPATPTVTFANDVLSSSSAAGYQWYRDGAIINGADGQQYTPTQNGSYTVVITDASGCSSQSAAVPVVISSIADVVNKLTVSVQPNPSTGVFYLSAANLSGTSNIVILDMAGREVFNQTVEGQLQQYPLDLSSTADGVYILRLSNGDAVNNTRLIVY